MQGRWTIQGMRNYGHVVRGDDLPDVGQRVPVVPCDDAAIERAMRAIPMAGDRRAIAEAVLRAAGETP